MKNEKEVKESPNISENGKRWNYNRQLQKFKKSKQVTRNEIESVIIIKIPKHLVEEYNIYPFQTTIKN